MNRRLTILTIAAAALCGLFAFAQASSQLSMMPEMDLGCLSTCLDQATPDTVVPILTVLMAVVVAAAGQAFVSPALASRFETSAVASADNRIRRYLSQRRE
ncbi:hypothetical protein A2856_02595 [Candidatus Uhrbacteria bacterium RIFCSPHIGHO2_01_FULL_63_20]|uniref:Uncharacterized protein n=1 Tax=Candidatus Uhrbacteria bacterium RIFCSPHIGHO2_01_FULL_63_20 TaxID=1802385 RepID=A0A1F7TKL1_9BACT|nr:MAG: hypothetical protein A2856_02595 [Candidatus Uhrbacteria bacterium RIFCSPHIGHO2_01_FULL_63_20]